MALLSPYFPYPLSHGGVVRIYNLLREMAREFDIELFAFCEPGRRGGGRAHSGMLRARGHGPQAALPRAALVHPAAARGHGVPRAGHAEGPRRGAPPCSASNCCKWSTRNWPSTAGTRWWSTTSPSTFSARWRAKRRTLGAWWDYYRWRRFETRQTARYRRVVAMSRKDAELLGPGVRATVIENGVDLARFQPQPETPGQRLLFIGSFQHFPNIAAYRFFTERVWPLLRDKFPEMTLTVVGGSDHLIHWRAFTELPEPPPDERIRLLGFVEDVRPLYLEANLVIVPTTVSAGTNLKVLEAMAMRRAVVSTTSGCAGLGLLHGHSVWVGDAPEAFAAGVATLMADPERREQIAEAAWRHAVRNFGWEAIGEKQRKLLRELLGSLSENRST